jgi:hypothetical protein
MFRKLLANPTSERNWASRKQLVTDNQGARQNMNYHAHLPHPKLQSCRRSHLMKSIVLPPLSLFTAPSRERVSRSIVVDFHTTKLDRPVISIGNITTGGTGKHRSSNTSRGHRAQEKGLHPDAWLRSQGSASAGDRFDGYGVLASPSEAVTNRICWLRS